MSDLPSRRLDPRMLRVWYVSDVIGIVVAPRARLQRMRVSQSPFQRRAGVATLSVRTAVGTEEGLGLRDVPADEADVLLGWFRPRGRNLNGPKAPN